MSERSPQLCEAAPVEWHHASSAWLRDHPDEELRVFGNYDGSIRDLEFLELYAGLRGFAIDTMRGAVPDLAGLRHLPDDLRSLRLGVPSGDDGIALLDRCTRLESLSVAAHRRLPTAIARSPELLDLSIEGPVRDLQSLAIKLGGTRNLSLLPELGPLIRLEVWMVRGLSDISAVRGVETLEELTLESLANVDRLPDLTRLRSLRTVELGNMKGLTDLTPLADAPALEHLWIWDATHLRADAVRPLVGHPTLRSARIGLGSERRNQAVQDLLGLPDRTS